MDWTSYHSLEEIYAWLDELAAEFPNVVTLFEIGESYEGRTTRGLKMSHRAGNQAIFVEANIHAREWISSATATWTINELLRSTDSGIRNIADNYDWYFIPVSNPDGYEYSRTDVKLKLRKFS
jgi:murein tripeptide amidase MpaA